MTVGPAVRVLGTVGVVDAGGRVVPAPGALPARLLVALALAGRDGRSAAGLADDVWPDGGPRNPRAALQMLVSRVRAAGVDAAVESTPVGYRAAGSDLAAAEHADAADALDALALWTGEPGAALEDGALAEELADRAARARRRLLAAAAERLQQEGRSADALPLLQEAADGDPLDGAAARGLMRGLAATGAVDRALAAFARHREALADALGADPDPATTALNAELLRAGDVRTAELVGVRAAATPLVGRDEEVAALLAAVPAHRLTSVVGTGGLGKTRLAHEVAARLAHRFDRIVFVELVGTRTADDVALVVGAASGARAAQPRRLGDPPPPDLASRTREALAAGRTLVILDNCEHVVDAAAAITADLLADLPELTVLTTSRVPLLLAGEQVVAPRPLPADGAGASLFVARASAARPGVQLDPALVAAVCERLDGLPLAIELAAARLRSMSLAELDRRLTDRFAVLVGGDRSAPERHRTLLAVIDWSRRLLSPQARDALSLLALFPDGFVASAASAALDVDAADVLTELVDQSLLAFADTGGGRFRMLETVREFGLRDLADTGRLAAARAGVDRWALGLVREVGPRLLLGRDPAAGPEVRAEEEDLLSVVRADPRGREAVVVAVWGLLAEHWVYRGEFESALDALPLLLGAASVRPADAASRDDALRALVLATAVTAATRSPATARVLALLRRALRIGPPGTGFWPSIAAEVLTEFTPDAIERTVERLSGASDPAVRALAMALQAQLLENRGESDRALALLQQVDALAARHGFGWLRLFGRVSATSLRSQRGEHAVALRDALALREEAERLGIALGFQQLDWLIGTEEVAIGEFDRAAGRFEALLASSEHARGPDAADSTALALAGLAEVAAGRGDVGTAVGTWERALVLARRATWPWRVLVLAASLAARLRLGTAPEALLGDYRRLRSVLLALPRLEQQATDAPVFGAGLLGVAAVLNALGEDDAGADAAGLGLALGARRDLTALDRVATGAAAAGADRDTAMRRAAELLRSPAARR